MSQVVVPDIGDFKEVEVIEILVKPGDAVAKEQSLITLESDKATMEIPSPADGVVQRAEGQGRRQGFEGRPDPGARRKRNGEAPPRRRKAAGEGEAPAANGDPSRCRCPTSATSRKSR